MSAGLIYYEKGKNLYTAEQRLGSLIEVDPAAKRPRYFENDSGQWWRKGVQPRRDSFRARSYSAEDEFKLGYEQRAFANICEVAKYVRDFMEKPWFQRRFPSFKKCQVEYKPRTRHCLGGPVETNDDGEVTLGYIGMSAWGLGNESYSGGEIVVLHELAHAVLPDCHMHDRRWAQTFLEFVGRGTCHDNMLLLKECFKGRGVPYTPFKKVHPSLEHIERLKKARKNK